MFVSLIFSDYSNPYRTLLGGFPSSHFPSFLFSLLSSSPPPSPKRNLKKKQMLTETPSDPLSDEKLVAHYKKRVGVSSTKNGVNTSRTEWLAQLCMSPFKFPAVRPTEQEQKEDEELVHYIEQQKTLKQQQQQQQQQQTQSKTKKGDSDSDSGTEQARGHEKKRRAKKSGREARNMRRKTDREPSVVLPVDRPEPETPVPPPQNLFVRPPPPAG